MAKGEIGSERYTLATRVVSSMQLVPKKQKNKKTLKPVGLRVYCTRQQCLYEP
jgi:hypothetical protein